MDILIPDEWLREHVKAKVTQKNLAQKISLCGPSIEKISGKGKASVYHIEVTTNRIDAASVYGVAREVSAILPRFGIKAKLNPLPKIKLQKTNRIGMEIVADPNLTKRIMAVKVENIKNWETPLWMKKRLEMSGVRSLNSAVDITNYVMLEYGHPTHVFDWDKVKELGFFIRASKKGEKITSLENKTYTLTGGDIVIVNRVGEIVDLPGIIGTKNSVVTSATKNVLFFIDNTDPKKIRKTSMELAIRTNAAALNEKGVDPELSEIAMARGIELFKKVCRAQVENKVFDWYPNPYQQKEIKIEKNQIEKTLGTTTLTKGQMTSFIKPLGFSPTWSGEVLTVKVPSWRASDINIPEDIVEEIARIYGYFNLPSVLPVGMLPQTKPSEIYSFESHVKNYLVGFGGYEVYTLSLVPATETNQNAVRIKNPLGRDFEYMRTNLYPSLRKILHENKREKDKFMLFEIASIYEENKNNLPLEKPTLGVIFYKYSFREAKGVLELLMQKLNLNFDLESSQINGLQKNKAVLVKTKNKVLGHFGVTPEDQIYLELDINLLLAHYKPHSTFKKIPKYPPQIEDITININGQVFLGELIDSLSLISKKINKLDLVDQYKNNYTLRVYYQDPNKTLTDREVSIERKKLLSYINKKTGVKVKA